MNFFARSKWLFDHFCTFFVVLVFFESFIAFFVPCGTMAATFPHLISSYIISSSLQKMRQHDAKHTISEPWQWLCTRLIVLQTPPVLMQLWVDAATHRDIDRLLLFYLFFCHAPKSRLLAWQSRFKNAQWSIDRPPLPHPALFSGTRSVSSPHWSTGRAVATGPNC